MKKSIELFQKALGESDPGKRLLIIQELAAAYRQEQYEEEKLKQFKQQQKDKEWADDFVDFLFNPFGL